MTGAYLTNEQIIVDVRILYVSFCKCIRLASLEEQSVGIKVGGFCPRP